jgi:O-antigen/teichoic acid export membrane protein
MKKLLKVSFLSGILTVFRMGCGFIIIKVIAIYTGPSGIASLGQFQSLISSFNGIANAPVGSGIVRYTSENQKNGFEACSPWWQAGLHFSLYLSIPLMLLGILLSPYISKWLLGDSNYYLPVILACLFLPFGMFGTFITSVVNGLQQYRRYMLFGMASVLISMIIMIFFVSQGGLNGALIAAALQTGLAGFVLIILVWKQDWFKKKYLFKKPAKKNITAIGKYVLMAITSAVFVPLSLILVRKILIHNVGLTETGYFQSVWKISEVYLGIITTALSVYYLPQLSKLTQFEDIKKEINHVTKIIMPFVILLAILVYIFRDTIIALLFTSSFAPCRDLFLIQLVGDVVKILSWLYAYPMLSSGNAKWFIVTEIIFAGGFVLFSFIFVNLYGIHGANYAYLLNYALYCVIMYINLRRFYFEKAHPT